jgi:hypothetical protein
MSEIQELEVGSVKTIKQMITMLEEVLADAEKSDRGQKAAGTRVRKVLQEIRVISQAERKAIQERKNSTTN